MQVKEKVYSREFWRLCMSGFLFFASFNMIIPELPAYLTNLGGEDYKGLIISLFTLTAALSRPFSGKLTDTIGRKPVMIFGALICGVCGFIYPMISGLAGFFALRLLHGLSTGFKPTAASAYLADKIPFNKRGEAMGIFGTFGSAGMAFGPAIGSPLANWMGLDMMFYASAALAILASMMIYSLPESHPSPAAFTFTQLKVKWKEIFDFNVWPPSLLIILAAFSFGVVLTIIPDFSAHLGLENKGLFFMVFTLSSIAVRLFAGKASDKYGRLPVLLVSSFMMCISMFMLAIAKEVSFMLFAGVIYGLANGINAPTIFAYTVDLSREQFRGRAMATMYIALEIGIGSGAFLSGWIFANKAENFFASFMLPAALAGSAFLIILYWLIKKPKAT